MFYLLSTVFMFCFKISAYISVCLWCYKQLWLVCASGGRGHTRNMLTYLHKDQSKLEYRGNTICLVQIFAVNH
jgi:hypothetical protein